MPMGSEEWQSFDFQQQSLSHHISQGENSKHLLKIKRFYKPHLIKFSFTAFIYLPKQLPLPFSISINKPIQNKYMYTNMSSLFTINKM